MAKKACWGFPLQMVVCALALGVPGFPNTQAASTAKPNIVLILADDMGYGDPHCYNPQSKVPTPHMDRLAADGARFTDAHSPSSVCSPTRYSVLTGRYCWRTRLKLGVLNQWDPPLIESGRLTMGAMLQKHGYTTAAFGKWHLGWRWATFDGKPPQPKKGEDYRTKIDFSRPISEGPTTRGFDYFFGMVGNALSEPCLIENNRPLFTGQGKGPAIEGVSPSLLDNWHDRNTLPMLTEKVVWYLEQRAREQPRRPFFVYFALTAPHNPILPHPSFCGKTGHGGYCDFVYQVDWTIGQVVKALDGHGLADNTLIVVSSDNGSPGYADQGTTTASIMSAYGHFPSGPWRGMKADIHEGGHRVPLIARWPGRIKPNTTCKETVCLVDLMATCAAIVGEDLPQDAGEDSYNILPALLGQPRREPLREATVHHSLTGMFAIRQGDWKLILGLGSGGFTMPQHIEPKPGEPVGQLYNLAEDPTESKNLYSDRADVVKRLTELLEKCRSSGRSAPPSRR